MNTDFDTLWKESRETPCPLTDEQLENMIVRAMEEPPSVEPLPMVKVRRLFRPWLIGVAVAAALVALIVPISTRFQTSPKRIDYKGQSVSFITNNNCEVDSVINALNIYIAQL